MTFTGLIWCLCTHIINSYFESAIIFNTCICICRLWIGICKYIPLFRIDGSLRGMIAVSLNLLQRELDATDTFNRRTQHFSYKC